MSLKIIRYKHYGGVMTTDGEPTIIYWSFFELSNGKVIETQYFDYNNGNWNDLYFTIQIAIHLVKNSLIGGIDIWQMTMTEKKCQK